MPLFVRNGGLKLDVEQYVMSRYLDRKYHEDFLNRELLKRIREKRGIQMSTADKLFRKLNFMQRCVDYLKSIDPESPDLESNYEKRSAIERNFQLAVKKVVELL